MYENYTGTPSRRKPDTEEEGVEPDVLNEHWEEPGDPDGVIAADEKRKYEEQRLTAEPTLPPKRKRKHRVLKFFVALVIIAAAAVGAFKFGDYKATPPSAKPTPKVAPIKSSAAPKVIATKHYDSTTYLLGFDYPQDWTVADTAAKLTVTSPVVQLASVSKGKISGRVILTVQNKQAAISGYPANGAIEVIESDKLTYKQPSEVQRAQTYISYLSFASATGLDVIYVTGDNGYLAQQYVPMSDVIEGDPLVGISFEACANADCSANSPVTILASNWKSTSYSTQVTNILQSIQLD